MAFGNSVDAMPGGLFKRLSGGPSPRRQHG